jgi:hypothetical protein
MGQARTRALGRAAVLAMTITLIASTGALAAVSTDQPDYTPGSTVTIAGNNSNDAGYVPGNQVDVAVTGPNGWSAACLATVSGTGTWSCQVILDADPGVAVGEYSYTAVQKDAEGNVVSNESGTFTDSVAISIDGATFAWKTTGAVPGGFDVAVSGKYTCSTNTSGSNIGCSAPTGVTVDILPNGGGGPIGSRTVSSSTAGNNVSWSTTLEFRASPSGTQIAIPTDGKYDVRATLNATFDESCTTACRATQTGYFGVDNGKPTSAISTVTATSTPSATGTATDAASGFENAQNPKPVHVEIRTNPGNVLVAGSGDDLTLSNLGSTKLTGDWSYVYGGSALPYGAYCLVSQATDLAGNVQEPATSSCFTLAPSNTPPVIASDNSTVTVDEGQTATNTGTWSDSNSGDIVGLTASVGTVNKLGANADGTWSWSYPTTDGPDDSQTVTITADDGLATTTTTFSLVVNNVAPATAFTSAPATANEGQTKTYEFSVSDPGADTYSASYDCGTDGSYVADSFSIGGNSGSQTGSFQCFFPDGPATPTVSISFTDSDGAEGNTATREVTVNNVAPTPAIDSLTGNSGVACIAGNTVTLGISWTDPAHANDTYSYDVNWGDGSHSKSSGFPTANLLYGDSPVGGLTHTYAAGSYVISVTVADSDGDANTVSSGSFSFLYDRTGVLQPVNDTQAHQDPSIFKYGSTIPVKIEVTDCNGIPVSGLSPKIGVKKISSSTPGGTDETTTSTSGADSGTTMRWSDPLYIYNLATKSLSDSSATYQITITGPFQDVTALFGTRAK